MTTNDPPAGVTERFDPSTVTRPDPALMTYYLIVSLLTLVGFPFVILPLYFKYRTLRYAFDDKGVSMSRGTLFHRQIYLNYRRIQDIHVSRNLIQRRLGLASVALQTASASAGPEITIEGIRNPEPLRDYLYAQMRGAPEGREGHQLLADKASECDAPADEGLVLLVEIRDELRRLREGNQGKSPS